MRMEETCSDGALPSCIGITTEEEINENITPLLAADSSVSCDTLNAAVSEPTQENLDKDYCMEASKLILDLGK